MNTQEHIKIGNKAYKEFLKKIRDDKDYVFIKENEKVFKKFSFGEVVALAGDFFGAPHDPITKKGYVDSQKAYHFSKAANTLLHDPEGLQLAIQTLEIDKTKSFIPKDLLHGWTFHNLKEVFFSHYAALQFNNIDHFMPNTLEAYNIGHTQAIRVAREAAQEKDQYKKKDLLRMAFQYEAFSCHYLTDAFAAGHMRVPRERLWKLGNESLIFARLAKLQHDEDGEVGIEIESDGNSESWITYGDGYLPIPSDWETKPLGELGAFGMASEAVVHGLIDIWTSFKKDADHREVNQFFPRIKKDSIHNANNTPLLKIDEETGTLMIRKSATKSCSEYDSLSSGYQVKLMYDSAPGDDSIKSHILYLYIIGGKLKYAVKEAGIVKRVEILPKELGEFYLVIKSILQDKDTARNLSDDETRALFSATSNKGFHQTKDEQILLLSHYLSYLKTTFEDLTNSLWSLIRKDKKEKLPLNIAKEEPVKASSLQAPSYPLFTDISSDFGSRYEQNCEYEERLQGPT